jgi:hypothetical protein
VIVISWVVALATMDDDIEFGEVFEGFENAGDTKAPRAF